MGFKLPSLHPRALVERLRAAPRPSAIDLGHHSVALAASVAFALAFGLNYGSSNQTAYMLGALKLHDSSLFVNDWYASHTANYHPAFSFIGWFLLLFGKRGMGVAVGQVVFITWGTMGVYALSRRLWRPWAKLLGHETWARTYGLGAFLLVLCFMTKTQTDSVGVSYIFDEILQPSTLGGVFLLLALPPFVDGRWLKSGVYLGLSGLFHANYLLLGLASFGLCHLMLGPKGIVRRGLAQLGPALIPLLILAPMILASARSPDAARAQEILFTLRSPHHYAPRTFEKAFYPFAGWQLLGLGLGGALLRRAGETGRRLGALFLAIAVVVWTGTLLTTVVYIPKVAQLFVFRLAPFLELFAQILIVAATMHVLVRPRLARQIGTGGWTVALIGGVVLALTKVKRDDSLPLSKGTIVAIVVALAVWIALRAALPLVGATRRFEPLARKVALGATVLVAAVAAFEIVLPPARAYRAHSNIYKQDTGPENELYAWLRKNTPKDAIILSPPQMERFRIASERAIVVDWKGSTYLPSELVDWYVRLEEVSGAKGFRRESELISGYGNLNDERLTTLKERYGLSYAVVGTGKERGLKGGRAVYKNGRYTVLALH